MGGICEIVSRDREGKNVAAGVKHDAVTSSETPFCSCWLFDLARCSVPL